MGSTLVPLIDASKPAADPSHDARGGRGSASISTVPISKLVTFLKALGEEVFTKFNVAALSTAGILVMLGVTEPVESVMPDDVAPGEVVELNQADVVFGEPDGNGAQKSATVTYVTTADTPFYAWNLMITATQHGEELPDERVEIVSTAELGAAAYPNPGVPFELEVFVPDEPGIAIVLNELTLRDSHLDMSTQWFDPVPAARLELT